MNNQQRRRELFRLADRLGAKLTSPHHPLTYNNHTMLRPGTYWHWSVMFDIAKPAYQGIGEFEHLLTVLYPGRSFVIAIHSFGNAEIFIPANYSDHADGHNPVPGEGYVPWQKASAE